MNIGYTAHGEDLLVSSERGRGVIPHHPHSQLAHSDNQPSLAGPWVCHECWLVIGRSTLAYLYSLNIFSAKVRVLVRDRAVASCTHTEHRAALTQSTEHTRQHGANAGKATFSLSSSSHSFSMFSHALVSYYPLLDTNATLFRITCVYTFLKLQYQIFCTLYSRCSSN